MKIQMYSIQGLSNQQTEYFECVIEFSTPLFLLAVHCIRFINKLNFNWHFFESDNRRIQINGVLHLMRNGEHREMPTA